MLSSVEQLSAALAKINSVDFASLHWERNDDYEQFLDGFLHHFGSFNEQLEKMMITSSECNRWFKVSSISFAADITPFLTLITVQQHVETLRKRGDHGDEVSASIVWDGIGEFLETISAFLSWHSDMATGGFNTVMKLRRFPDSKPPLFLRHDHMMDDRLGRYKANQLVAAGRIVSSKIAEYLVENPSGTRKRRAVDMHN